MVCAMGGACRRRGFEPRFVRPSRGPLARSPPPPPSASSSTIGTAGGWVACLVLVVFLMSSSDVIGICTIPKDHITKPRGPIMVRTRPKGGGGGGGGSTDTKIVAWSNVLCRQRRHHRFGFRLTAGGIFFCSILCVCTQNALNFMENSKMPENQKKNLCCNVAHKWATSDFVPRSEAYGIPQAVGVM